MLTVKGIFVYPHFDDATSVYMDGSCYSKVVLSVTAVMLKTCV